MKITITKDFRKLKTGDVYDFGSLDTLKMVTIVGDNGSGKSSLIHALRGVKNDAKCDSLFNSDYKKLAENISVEHSYEKIFFLDSVKDNGSDIMNGYDAVSFVTSGGMATSKMSHGQGSLTYIAMFLEKNKSSIVPDKTLLVFDEIDNGLSLKNMSKFINFVYNAIYIHKCHVLIISHNPFFITQSHICYDLVKKDFTTSSSYMMRETGYILQKPDEKEDDEKTKGD